MRKTARGLVVVVAALALVATAVSLAAGRDDDEDEFEARLAGYREVPAVSTAARGDFEAELVESSQAREIRYRLSYEGLEAPVLFAHIHFAQKDVNGGVSAFLCGGGGKPPCPQSGTVMGVVRPSDVIGPSGQGIAAGEFAELVRAMRAGVTYANVHSEKFPGGEIRGQIKGD
jgi:CHRD domain